MFDTPVSGFFTGLAFAGLLLCCGLYIGIYLGRLRARAEGMQPAEVQHLLEVVGGLAHWTNGLASEVSQYNLVVNGVTEWMRSNPTTAGSGKVATAVQLLTQIAEANELLRGRLEQAEATLKQQAEEVEAYMSEARTDALTHLPNRRAFDDELQRRIAEWHRHGSVLSVVMVDVDHFKRFNDRHGHQAGDAVLAQVAELLRRTLRESDLVARYGGEEFALILPAGNLHEARQAAERVRLAVKAARVTFESLSFQVTVSCGAAQALGEERGADLVRRADEALYAAKSAGRDCAFYHTGQACLPVSQQVRQRTSESPEDHDPAGSSAAETAASGADEHRSAVRPPAVSSSTEDAAARAYHPTAAVGISAHTLDAPSDFQRACDELRRKLQEVAAGGVDS